MNGRLGFWIEPDSAAPQPIDQLVTRERSGIRQNPADRIDAGELQTGEPELGLPRLVSRREDGA